MLIGGEKRKSEKARVRKGITILIATPGRLIDHITKTKCLSLKNIQWYFFSFSVIFYCIFKAGQVQQSHLEST